MAFDLSILTDSSVRVDNLTVHCCESVKVNNYFYCYKGLNKFDRFFYVISGHTVFTLENGDTVNAVAGDIVYLPNDCVYSSQWLGTESGGYINIRFNLINENGDMCCLGDRIKVIVNDKNQKFLSSFINIWDTWRSGSKNSRIKTMSMFWAILYDFSVYIDRRNLKRECQQIYKGVLFIENNYLSEISVDELARMCGISVCTFRRLFKQMKGMSPITYRNSLRMKKAKELLETGEYSVTEASDSVNCPNVYYFNRLFKSCYGINPSECRPGT